MLNYIFSVLLAVVSFINVKCDETMMSTMGPKMGTLLESIERDKEAWGQKLGITAENVKAALDKAQGDWQAFMDAITNDFNVAMEKAGAVFKDMESQFAKWKEAAMPEPEPTMIETLKRNQEEWAQKLGLTKEQVNEALGKANNDWETFKTTVQNEYGVQKEKADSVFQEVQTSFDKWKKEASEAMKAEVGHAEEAAENGKAEVAKGLEAAKEETEKGLEKAKEGLEKGKEEAEKAIQKGKEKLNDALGSNAPFRAPSFVLLFSTILVLVGIQS